MDANGLVVMPGMGPAWKMAPGRSSTLKLRNDETEESVMMFEEVAPIGTVTPMHLHHDSDEVAYVLSGEITFKIGDTVTVGGPGTCAFMPRDVAHAWKSTGAEAGRVLFLYTPGGAGKLFEGDDGTAGGPDEPAGVRRGCRTARLGDRRPAAVLSRGNPRTTNVAAMGQTRRY
jgi:quercetin dioxygenase-like cupin family protein